MSLLGVNFLGGGGGAPGSNGSLQSLANERSGGAAAALSQVNGANTTVAVAKTETTQAVQPTPASSKAVKVDLTADMPAKGDEIAYPVTGPDMFAKTMAIQNQQDVDEPVDADPAEGRSQAIEVGEQRRVAVEPEMVDPAVKADDVPKRAATDDATSDGRQSGFSPMTASESGEARLTA